MKLKLFIHAKYQEWSKEWEYAAWNSDMSDHGSFGTVVAEVEVEFTPPPVATLVGGQVEAWRKEQERIRAEALHAVSAIQQKIDDIRCLEYKPEVA